MKQGIVPVKFHPADIPAILCALDLVAAADSGNPAQNQLNFTNCCTAAQKLNSGRSSFTPNELRVIHVGLGFALDLLTGVHNPYISMDELEPEWAADLRRHLFVFNRLYPLFSDLTQNYK